MESWSTVNLPLLHDSMTPTLPIILQPETATIKCVKNNLPSLIIAAIVVFSHSVFV